MNRAPLVRAGLDDPEASASVSTSVSRSVSAVDDLAQRPLAYLAAPVVVFGTPLYTRRLDRLRALLGPGVDVVDAASCFTSRADWRRRWPCLLGSLTFVYFLTAPDDVIGAGVWEEVRDADLSRLPVYWLRGRGEPVPLAHLHLRVLHPSTPWRHAHVTLRPWPPPEGGAR